MDQSLCYPHTAGVPKSVISFSFLLLSSSFLPEQTAVFFQQTLAKQFCTCRTIYISNCNDFQNSLLIVFIQKCHRMQLVNNLCDFQTQFSS